MGEYIHTGDQIVVSNEVNYVRVKVMRTETRTVEVDYDTEKTNDASMFKVLPASPERAKKAKIR